METALEQERARTADLETRLAEKSQAHEQALAGARDTAERDSAEAEGRIKAVRQESEETAERIKTEADARIEEIRAAAESSDAERREAVAQAGRGRRTSRRRAEAEQCWR